MVKIIFSLSIFFFVAGMVTVSLTATWSIVSMVMILFSIFLFALSLALLKRKQKKWQNKPVKDNIIPLTTTIVTLLIVVAINVLSVKYNIRWNLSENQLQALSSQSQAVVTELKQPIKVLVFDQDIDTNLKILLENYHRASNQFEFELIDPEQESGLASQYGVKSLGEIYLQYGEKKQKLDPSTTSAGEILTEIQLTNSIEKIKRDRTRNIYLLQGHGEASNQMVERGIAQIVNNLKSKGNNVSELNFATDGKIPSDADLIVIPGATRKLLAAEVSGLQTYLSTGGNLLLLLSPNTDIGITPLLQEWGVELDDRLVVDGSGSAKIMGFGPGVAIVDDYGDHPITASFGNGISIVPESRPLKAIAKTGIISTPLAITNEKTWAESDLKNEEITFDPNQDLSGPLNIAIAFKREEPEVSRMVIFGSSTFATNGWFEQQLNGDLIVNSINWLIGEEQEALAIQPRESANRRINLSSTQIKIINWLTLPIVPVSALIVAIFISCRHR